ncbi:MAG TPA: hypothetical protein VFA92_09855, partial [Candidatus Binatia bacterium]|nr:hypothetical protein [Candidatus Binatia bacterium]
AIDAYLAFCEREEAVHRFLLAQRGHAGRRVASAPDDVGARIAAGIADGFRSRRQGAPRTCSRPILFPTGPTTP